VLLSTARAVGEELVEGLRAHPAAARVELAGSARRWADTCKDLDVVAATEDLQALTDGFAALPQIDVDRLIEAAARTGTFLEIAANPNRRDLSDVHARAAAAAGVKLVIDSDAHRAGDAGPDPLRDRDGAAGLADRRRRGEHAAVERAHCLTAESADADGEDGLKPSTTYEVLPPLLALATLIVDRSGLGFRVAISKKPKVALPPM
jgi:hypothetical protein